MNNILKLLNKVVIGLLIAGLQLIWFMHLINSLGQWMSIVYFVIFMLSFSLLLYIFAQRIVPETKLYWVILILLFPIFGIPLYIICHSSLELFQLKRRIQLQEKNAQRYQSNDEKNLQTLKNENPQIYSQINYLHHNHFSIYENFEVQYYPYGTDAYPDMLIALKQAQHFIFVEYFIISEGQMWQEILEILKEKAMSGVEVRILYDDIGSAFRLKKNYIAPLSKYQIKIMSFYPKTIFPATDNRNHRKTLIVDGEIAFTGGINIADECIKKTQKYGVWKDSSIRVRGDAVFEFTKMFLVMWNANIDSSLASKISPDQNYEQYKRKSKQYHSSGYLIPYHHNPFNKKLVASRVYLNIINQATNYLYIYTPYLILDYAMKEALLLAAERGVEIKIITPGIPDKKLVYQVTRSNYVELLEAGIKIYEYTPGFLHAKCFLCDDKVATIGAVNLDYRSLYTHFENGCYFYRGEIINIMKNDFDKTLSSSKEISPSNLQKNLLQKIWATLLNLFSPLL